MPFPIVASGVAAVVAYLGKKTLDYATTKGALTLYVVSSVIVLAGVFNALITSIVMTAPPVIPFFFGVLPSNLASCMAAAIGARISLYVFEWKAKVVLSAATS